MKRGRTTRLDHSRSLVGNHRARVTGMGLRVTVGASILLAVAIAPANSLRQAAPTLALPPEADELIKLSRELPALVGDDPTALAKIDRRHAQAVAAHIRANSGIESYHLLIWLRMSDPRVYNALSPETRAEVLCAALATTDATNDFGTLTPGACSDAIAGKLMRETGVAAIPFLLPILSDPAEALPYGSEAPMIARHWQVRRADFAYRYIMLAMGYEPKFLPTPVERDRLILELQELLQRPD